MRQYGQDYMKSVNKKSFESFLNKRIFSNHIEDQREYVATLDKRRHLARMKFEEHCEPKGKNPEEICPLLEQCLSTSSTQAQSKPFCTSVKQYSLRALLEQRENDNQFFHNFNRRKRVFFILFHH
jgi:hypothetical protein